MKKHTNFRVKCSKANYLMRIMKAYLFFLIFGISTAFATSTYSQTTKLSISLKNVSIEELFSEIERNSEYIFFYKENVPVNSKVSVEAKNETLDQVLEKALPSNNLLYRINDRQVVITENVTTKKMQSPARVSTQNTVTGIVVDNNGEPLVGVSVVIRGTSKGMTTDMDGRFSIQVESGQTLDFSYLGYTKTSLAVSGVQNDIKIIMTEDTQTIDEVVVIGYGAQTKSRMISSVGTINAAEINSRAVSMASQAVTGKVSGISSIQRSGRPGNDGTAIQIRGVGSYGASSSPMVLVDGMPGSLSQTSPNDIESITFLKDAASAAIYGARAANGVILVTTKMGKDERLTVNYNGYVSMQTPTQLPKMVSSWEHAELMNEAIPGSFSAEDIQKFKDGNDPDKYPNADYINNFFKNSMQTGHNLALSSAGKVTQFAVSLNYMYQDGIVDKNYYDRYSIRANMVNNISSSLKLTTRLSGRIVNDHQPSTPATLDYTDLENTISNVVRIPATIPYKLSNGQWGTGLENKGTPFSFVASDSYYDYVNTRLDVSTQLDWTIIPGLKASLIAGYNQDDVSDKRFRATQELANNVFLSPSSLNEGYGHYDYKTLQELLEYSKAIGKHDMKILLGHSYEENTYRGFGAGRKNFPSNDYPYLNLGDAEGQTNSGTANANALDSYFGRLHYNYAAKYLAEFSARYDGSSRFPESKKYGFFPSVAVGWRIAEESFIKDNFSWLNELKIKGSYGVLGNQEIGNYPYQNVYSSGYNYPFNNTIFTGLANTTLKDPNIHWESTETKDLGLEFSVFDRKLSGSVSYFDKYTYDILTSPGSSISNVLGFAVGVQNSGELQNRGWEFTLDYKNSIGDFKYGVAGNFTITNNKVLSLGVGNVEQLNGWTGDGARFIGYPMGMYFGYKTDGLYIDQNDVTEWTKVHNQSKVNPNPKPGDVRYVDVSQDGIVDTKDYVFLGSNIPKYTFGVTLNGEYKNFDLSILLQGITGVEGRLDTYAGYAFYSISTIQTWQRDARWTTENPSRDAKYPRLESPMSSSKNAYQNNASDYWILDGSYLRIKNIQLGYTLPQKALNTLRLKGMRLALSAENLYTFDNYPTGWDPETIGGANYYPILANYTFSVNLSF